LAITHDAASLHNKIINLQNALPDYNVAARNVPRFKCYLRNYANNIRTDVFTSRYYYPMVCLFAFYQSNNRDRYNDQLRQTGSNNSISTLTSLILCFPVWLKSLAQVLHTGWPPLRLP